MTVSDAFQSFTRYWDRITRPEQLIPSLPQAVATMLDPADCGPVFIALPQDIQAEAFDYPEVFFEKMVHQIPRPRPDKDSIAEAANKAGYKDTHTLRNQACKLRRECADGIN
jgi:3D-(3,5/4)-trihydroxycyclohexane-1,2-dione acylhydrolase (decyclizing)